jgi:hypothetical protein
LLKLKLKPAQSWIGVLCGSDETSNAEIKKRRRLRLACGPARETQLEARPNGFSILLEALHACSGHPWHRNVEYLEALLFERKLAMQRHFGGNRQCSGFLDSNGLYMVLRCSHRTKASKGNDNCLEGFIPA